MKVKLFSKQNTSMKVFGNLPLTELFLTCLSLSGMKKPLNKSLLCRK